MKNAHAQVLPPDEVVPQKRADTAVRVRKNVKALTLKERHEYVKAVLKLKKTPSPYTPGLSYYDQFVEWHRSLYVCGPAPEMGTSETGGMDMDHQAMAHGGPLFLPWHRKYVQLFEDALREVSGNKDITVPYWDWTDEASTAALFQDDFMGGDGDPNDGYAVHGGPFRKGQWAVTIQPQGIVEQASCWPHLVRRFGSIPTASKLPSAQEVQTALATPVYDVAPWDTTSDWTRSFRNNLEGFRDPPGQNSMVCGPDGIMMVLPLNPPTLHNAVHGWVGGLVGVTESQLPQFGTMVTATSPNDPVFFIHHANVDRLWAEWQRLHGVHTYAPRSGGVPGSNVDDMLMPYHEAGIMVTPGDVEDISAMNYRYE